MRFPRHGRDAHATDSRSCGFGDTELVHFVFEDAARHTEAFRGLGLHIAGFFERLQNHAAFELLHRRFEGCGITRRFWLMLGALRHGNRRTSGRLSLQAVG